ncbi:MAG: CDP-diacylglycerol--glycerol-3-phosphate 3-phosphatidyltransferase [Kiritimatiellae bacterium]|nr:CDP-diacylglycerol--glycerol-3-phosphate 3-phosphatidyltransferase [Kiritimatiellia bacterium]
MKPPGIPNILTISRLFFAWTLTVFLTFNIPWGKTLALVAFILASITDWLDGRLARSGHGITLFGQLMDPVADKVLVCAAFVSFVSIHQIVPAWIVIIILTREFMVTGLRLMAVTKGRMVSAGIWGKHKTAWQIVAIIVIMLGLALREDLLAVMLGDVARSESFLAAYNRYFSYVTYWISFLVAVLTVISGAVYYWRERRMLLGLEDGDGEPKTEASKVEREESTVEGERSKV